MSDILPDKYYYKTDPVTRMFRAVDKGWAFSLVRNYEDEWVATFSSQQGAKIIAWSTEDPTKAIEDSLTKLGRDF